MTPGGLQSNRSVAVVGIGCRFPGASGPAAFWDLLTAGRSPITRWPRDRWERAQSLLPGNRIPYDAGKAQWGGFLDELETFDPDFFQISHREAALMDPQQRLSLETAWHTFEDAGILPERLAEGRTGVFLGIGNFGYGVLTHCHGPDDIHSILGVTNCLAPNRISYHFNLKGPSIAVDTACSSSLLAVLQACRSITSGECDAALAGGVNVLCLPEISAKFVEAGLVSEDGRCRSFDASAAGYVRSEGVGLVLLKPLSAAVRDGDRIYAVIRGGAVNQDGRSNGLTAPNPQAQKAVLTEACLASDVSPASIDVVEAQGTATKLGDPIELNALATVYGKDRASSRPLLVGSVKTNIGHLESAAGIAALLKTCLSLHFRQIPPHLHFSKPNPYVDFERLGLRVPVALTPWPDTGEPARAGVSAFGWGGTNVHLILEEAPKPARLEPVRDRPLTVLALSARTPDALCRLASKSAFELEHAPALSLANFCYSMSAGRSRFPRRLAVAASDRGSMAQKLREILANPDEHLIDPRPSNARIRVAFLFPDEHPCDPSAFAALFESSPVFRETIERCDTALQDLIPFRFSEFFDDGCQPAVPRDIRLAAGHSRLVACQVALAEFLISCGAQPSTVSGFGTGEISAAVCAGVLRCEDAVRFAAQRAALLATAIEPSARALIVESDGAALAPLLEPFRAEAAIVAFHSPDQIRIAGSLSATQEIERLLHTAGISCRDASNTVLPTPHPDRLRPLLPGLRSLAAHLPSDRPHVSMILSVSGDKLQPAPLDPDYWVKQWTAPARIDRTLHRFQIEKVETIVSFGPGRIPPAEAASLPTHHPFRAGEEVWIGILECLADLHRSGAPIDWAAVDSGQNRRRMFVPGYPFQKNFFWLAPVLKNEVGVLPIEQDVPAIPATAQPPARDCEESGHSIESASFHVIRPAMDLAEIERLLLSAWTAVLQNPGLQPSSDFFECGGDSLMTTRLLDILHQELGFEVSLSSLMAYRTPETLACHLVESRFSEDSQPSTAESAFPESVVPIQMLGFGSPLFWIHAMGGGPGGGLVRFHGLFDDLSRRMNQDRPFYGVRTSGEPYLSVEEMAEAFTRDLIGVQPQGPYQIGAYCSSGVVAYEIARILHNQGRAIGAVLLIDPPSPTGGTDSKFRITDWPARVRNLGRWTVDHIVHNPKRMLHGWGRLRARFSHAHGSEQAPSAGPSSRAGALALGDVLDLASYPQAARRYAEAHWKAYQVYRPRPYQGSLHLFVPKVQGLLWSNSIRAWRSLACGGIALHEIPGNHNSMLQEPHVEQLTRAIAACLPKAEDPHSHS